MGTSFDPEYRQRLTNHPTVAALGGGASGPLASIVGGLVFAVVGFVVMAVGAGLLGADATDPKVPGEVLVAIGAVFAVPGLGLLLSVVLRRTKAGRVDRLAEQRPNEPWLGDYDWPARFAPDKARGLLKPFGFALFITVSMVPFNYLVVFGKDDVPLFAIAVVGLFDLVLVYLWYRVLYTVARRIKYSSGKLEYGSFPLFVGQTSAVTFHLPASLAGYSHLDVTLRCIQEHWERRRGSKGSNRALVADALYENPRRLTATEVSGRRLPLSIEPPSGAPGCALQRRDPTYWELEIAAETPGIDYRALFMLPVYERPTSVQNYGS